MLLVTLGAVLFCYALYAVLNHVDRAQNGAQDPQFGIIHVVIYLAYSLTCFLPRGGLRGTSMRRRARRWRANCRR